MKPRRSISEQIWTETWLELRVGTCYDNLHLVGLATPELRMSAMRDAIARTGGGKRVIATRLGGNEITAAQAFQETYGEAL